MGSFRAQIGWKRPRMCENKSYHSVAFLPDSKYKIEQKQKKNPKYKTIPLWLHFKPKQVRKGQERVKMKIIVPFRSYPKRNRKFHKNS